MSILNSCLVIAGILTFDGQPLPSMEVLLIQENPYKVVGAAVTDEGGNFAITAPAACPTLHLVAKLCHQEIATVIHREIRAAEFGTSVNLEGRQESLVPVHCKLKMPRHAPPSMDIFIDLQAVNGIPQGLQPYFRYSSPNTASSYFYRFATQEQAFTWWVTPGRIRVGADYMVVEDGLMSDHKHEQFAVTSITRQPSGEKIDGKWMLGFELDVQEETFLELHVEPVKQ